MIDLDKITHALACYAIVLTVGLWLPSYIGAICGFALALLVGYVKELRDTTFSVQDWLADLAGAVVGTIMLTIRLMIL